MVYINKNWFRRAHKCLRNTEEYPELIMNVKIALLFFVAVAFYAKAELETEYHPQAVLHYLEMEDRKMAEKVRSIVKVKEDGPKLSSSPKLPGGLPNGIPPKIVSIRA